MMFEDSDASYAARLRGATAPNRSFKPGDQVGWVGLRSDDQSELHNAGIVVEVPNYGDNWNRGRVLVIWDNSTDSNPNKTWISWTLIEHLPKDHPRRFEEGQAVHLTTAWGRTRAVIKELMPDGRIRIEWVDRYGPPALDAVWRGRINPPEH